VLELLLAAAALAMQLPLYTRNPDDFAGLHELIEIVGV
jgi:predicted nucleic acid-binding protein